MDNQRHIEHESYRDAPYGADEPCRHSGVQRTDYFEQIPQRLLNSALVLLDPDTGIEVKSMTRKKEREYVLHDDLDALSRRMSAGSTLAVFQWANQFVCLNRHFADLAPRILERCPAAECLDWIARVPVGYLFISKDPEVHVRTAAVLASHSGRWKKDFVFGSLCRTRRYGAAAKRTKEKMKPKHPTDMSPEDSARPSALSETQTVHTDEGKETDPGKAGGRVSKEQWPQPPGASYRMQCQLCGKWLKGGIDAHVRGKHNFSHAAYKMLFG